MRNLKTLGIAGGLVTAALVGGTLISVVIAAPSGRGGTNAVAATHVDKARYCELWKTTFADELGVSVDDLLPAAKAAAIATIDAAVTAGDLTEARATELKARIEAADGSACRLLGHPFLGIGHHLRAHFGRGLLDAAASALGMEPDALMEALRGGDTLQEITTAQGEDYGDVSKAVHDAAKAGLDAAVANGRLDQARADEILANLDEALATGAFPRHRPGFGERFGFPGPWHDEAGESPEAAAS